MVRTLRWFVCLPAALVASAIAGGLLYWLTSVIGSEWYCWMLSGMASAVTFFAVAFWVAPAQNVGLKWASVIIVGALGAMAALGPLMTGREPMSAIAGATMVGFAVYVGRRPVPEIQREIAQSLG